MSKKCTPLRREAHFKIKSVKNWRSRSTFGSWHVEKVHAVVAQSTFRSQKRKKIRDTEHFCVVGTRDCAPCQKWAKREGFVAVSKTIAGLGHLKSIWTVAGAVQETHELDVLGDQSWFPERVCILEHQIFSFGKMILCDGCSTLYDRASLFRGRRNASETWTGKIAKRIGTRPSALHSTFHYWRKSRRIASFLMLPSSKSEEVWQNCFVFKLADGHIDR